MALLWRTRLLALAAVLAVALLVAACGGGDDAKPSATATQQSGASSSATAEPEATDSGDDDSGDDDGGDNSGDLIDACTLLTKDEITAAVGETSEGDVTNDPPTSACFWSAFDEYQTTQVEFVLYEGTSQEGALDYYDAFTGSDVAGVGEKAKWVQSVGMLEVLEGKYVLDITVNQTEADAQNTAKSLAQKALDRLP